MEIRESSFQMPITIKEAVESIYRKSYFLPAIQREFVWSPEQIIKLFDSLMRGYTIGSFLFWNVSGEKIKDLQFYEFIREYHERDSKHNPKANVLGQNAITVVLDGQQRLTALYLALKGTYSYKVPRKRWNNDDAFPRRKLYLNLLSKSEEFGLLYDFAFLTDEETKKRDNKTFWFEVAKIIDFDGLRDINSFLRNNALIENKFSEECLFNLYEVITGKKVINYYLETSQELDMVLNIFIRVNSGGTQLSYSDLLLSIATAQWKTKDAKEEITTFVDEICRVGDGFEFDKDFVLKSCLILSDLKEIAFKVDSFNVDNMKKIESNWDEIVRALRIAIDLVSGFGYNYQNLTSANAIIPIGYYILKIGNPANFILSSRHREDRDKIRKWFTATLLKRSFSGQPDNVLRPIRTILQENHDSFPINKIIDKFKGTNKSLLFSSDDIENLLYLQYNQAYTFTVLSLLYPNLDYRNKFHVDHIFPKSMFKRSKLKGMGIPNDYWDLFLEDYNFLGNLQLLEGPINEEKSNMEFQDWLKKYCSKEGERKEYMKKHFIPDNVSLEFDNFVEFFNERKKLLLRKLMSILAVN